MAWDCLAEEVALEFDAPSLAEACDVVYEASRDQHRESARDYTAERRRWRRAIGACIECGAPALPGRMRCLVHTAANRLRARRGYDEQQAKRGKRAAAGLCRCGREPEEGGRMCSHCRELNRARCARYRGRAA